MMSMRAVIQKSYRQLIESPGYALAFYITAAAAFALASELFPASSAGLPKAFLIAAGLLLFPFNWLFYYISRVLQGRFSKLLRSHANTTTTNVRPARPEALLKIERRERKLFYRTTLIAASLTVIVAFCTTSYLKQEEIERTERAKQHVSELLKAAAISKSPFEQKEIFRRVLTLDPSNVAAIQGYDDAQQRILAQTGEDIAETQEYQNMSLARHALEQAEAAYLQGNVSTADQELTIAQQLAPTDPAARELRKRIDSARAENRRLGHLLFGGAFLAFGGLCSLFFIRLRKKQGYLQVVYGMDNGRRYNLNQEVIHIGAGALDGEQKNDIVLRDGEHMVSLFHCEIHHSNGKFYLVDCYSANGTRIDNQLATPGKPIRLRSGSIVDLASTVTLKFMLERRQKQTV